MSPRASGAAGCTRATSGTRVAQPKRVACDGAAGACEVRSYRHRNSPSWLARKFVTQ